jgi:hypothetical protein
MNELGQDGQPLRPFILDVLDEMQAIIPQIRNANPGLAHSQVLQSAYDRAVWANPETRSVLQQQAQTAEDERRRAANQSRVTEARRATAANIPSRPTSSGATPKPGRMEDTILEEARRLGLVSS